jgi:hypothetical protein
MRGWTTLILGVVLLASACSTVGTSSDGDRAALADPPRRIIDNVDALMPGGLAFVDESEREVLRRGRPLTADETRLAQAVGVAHPERVRVWVTDEFTRPRDREFILLARRLGIDVDEEEKGRAAGYGIQLKPRFQRSRRLLAHELTHVAQYERMGNAGLVRQYFLELLVVGYERSPIEAAARANERIEPGP